MNDRLTAVNFIAPVQDLIPKVEERMHTQADRHHPDLKLALDHLLSAGGKRIRPAIALLTGKMLGADPDKLVTLSAAIELHEQNKRYALVTMCVGVGQGVAAVIEKV